MFSAYLSPHNHPWQRLGRVAGCLWHKRPEPGLDPSHLWEKRQNTGVRRGGEAGGGTAGGERRAEKRGGESASESDGDTERHMCRRCVYVRACVFLNRGRVWRRASGSLCVTHYLTSTPGRTLSFTDSQTTSGSLRVLQFPLLNQPDNFKTHYRR